METIGQRLGALRKALKRTQIEVAAAVGVTQGMYCRWEADALAVPSRHLLAVASALGVDFSRLAEVHLSGERGPHRLPPCLAQQRGRSVKLPPYPIQGSIDQMLDIAEIAVDLYQHVARQVPRGLLARLEQRFPRDNEWELLSVFHLLALGARLYRLTLAQLRCPLLAVVGRESAASGAYFLRDALVLETDAFSAILFPQVWVVSVVQSEWYRLDFLACVQSRQGKVRWGDVELDGNISHAGRREQDERRSRGIGVPRLGFRAQELLRPDFGPALVRRLAWLLDSASAYSR